MPVRGDRIIWQYWETRGEKPRFIDGLHAIAAKNAGVRTIVVTPETLHDYLPDIEDGVFAIGDVAHKADMIRTRLVRRYGGMWLDSDAVVLTDLSWMFDLLDAHEFVGFNNEGRLQRERPFVRVNCFLSRPKGSVVSEWVRKQRAKLPKTEFGWAEIGADMLNEICLRHPDSLKILPFERICPIGHREVEKFLATSDVLADRILDECWIVMLTNRAIANKGLPLPQRTAEEIAAGDYVLSRIVSRALDGPRTGATPSEGPRLVEVDAMFGRIQSFENDIITTQIAKFGAHTRCEVAFLLSVVRPGDTVFDIGAHIGTFAIPLAQKIGPQGQLLAVEARPENFAVLERNLESTHAANVVAENRLVGRAGRYVAVTPMGNTGGTYFVPGDAAAPDIATTSIDGLCAAHFTPRVVKIDIEGGELAALADTRLLRNERPIVYAEINGKALAQQGASIGEIEALFRVYGYRMFRNVGDRNAAHDNFVVSELTALPTNLNNFDVLAVHTTDERLDGLLRRL